MHWLEGVSYLLSIKLIRATIETLDGVTRLTCHNCGYDWTPRKPSPVECPCCKTHLFVSEKMQERIKERNSPPEIVPVREIVSDIFTAQCAECEEDAVVKFKGRFLCEVHLLKEMKEGGMLRNV
jgi:hypothetical protein